MRGGMRTAKPKPDRAHIDRAFAEEELRASRIAVRIRLVSILVLAVWITVENGMPEGLFYHATLGGFAAIGVAPLVLKRRGRFAPWHRYLFPTLDLVLLGLLVFSPNPFEGSWHPAAVRLRFGNEAYFFFLLAVSVFSYSPRVVLWTGISASLVWMTGTLWIALQPDSLVQRFGENWPLLPAERKLAWFLNPHGVYLSISGRLVLLMLGVSAALAIAVWRFRRILERSADAERARLNLSRYFSPKLVEQLSGSDQPLSTTRTQNVAVLFADVVGFTALVANRPPADVIGIVRDLHQRLAEAIFEFDGTLDKYLGDGVMATFGTPVSGGRDACHALQSARSMLRKVELWNVQRRDEGDTPIALSVGIQWGPVVLGDVGIEQQLEFAVIGDTVNIASRLQELTREMGVRILTTQDIIDRARNEGAAEGLELEGFYAIGPHTLRGRTGEVLLWGA